MSWWCQGEQQKSTGGYALHSWSLWDCLKNYHSSVLVSRWLQDNLLWACLAGMAVAAKELSTAEVAYAALDEVQCLVFCSVTTMHEGFTPLLHQLQHQQAYTHWNLTFRANARLTWTNATCLSSPFRLFLKFKCISRQMFLSYLTLTNILLLQRVHGLPLTRWRVCIGRQSSLHSSCQGSSFWRSPTGRAGIVPPKARGSWIDITSSRPHLSCYQSQSSPIQLG